MSRILTTIIIVLMLLGVVVMATSNFSRAYEPPRKTFIVKANDPINAGLIYCPDRDNDCDNQTSMGYGYLSASIISHRSNCTPFCGWVVYDYFFTIQLKDAFTAVLFTEEQNPTLSVWSNGSIASYSNPAPDPFWPCGWGCAYYGQQSQNFASVVSPDEVEFFTQINVFWGFCPFCSQIGTDNILTKMFTNGTGVTEYW